MQPAQLAEARMFSIEASIAEHEKDRLAEYDFLKTLIKKLIQALEQ